MKNIEKIYNFIGEDRLKRVYEVMDLLGVKLPENFDIYERYCYIGEKVDKADLSKHYYKTFAVILSDLQDKEIPEHLGYDELDKLGYFEFGEYRQKIVTIRNGIVYEWDNCWNVSESLNIALEEDRYTDKLSLGLIRMNKNLQTSRLYLNSDYNNPAINSFVTNVKLDVPHLREKEEAPITNYYDFFIRFLKNRVFDYHTPESLNNEHMFNLIAQLFEKPINELVNYVINNDQSWRYENEKKKIIEDCKSKIEEYEEECAKIIEEASAERDYEVQCAIKEQNKNLKKLRELLNQYEEFVAENHNIGGRTIK